MATAEEARLAVRNKYREMIGRNHYSQNLRNYAFTPYTDGKYYSDCSSSISYAYKEAGYGFGILNTVGMWESEKLTDVPVIIKSGQVTNPDVLRIGDMLLYAGTDNGRAKWGYVGHVEMVGEINGSTIMLYGHGSGLAKSHEMTAYNRYRYQQSSSTPIGNTGLIRVRRYIQSDGETTHGLKRGDKGAEVANLQRALLSLGYPLPKYGADGDFGEETEQAVTHFQAEHGLTASGIADKDTLEAIAAAQQDPGGSIVKVTGASVNVRVGNGTEYSTYGVVSKGMTFAWVATAENGWFAIKCGDQVLWISNKMSERQ